MHMVDWYPTLLKLAGAKPDQPLPLDGRDVWPTIAEGRPSPHESILLNTTPTDGAVRVGDWKLVLNGGQADGDSEDPAPKKKGKNKGKESVELFNLAEDLSEKTNLAEQRPDKVKELKAVLDGYARQAVPPKGNQPKAKGFVTPKVWGEAAE